MQPQSLASFLVAGEKVVSDRRGGEGVIESEGEWFDAA